MANTQNPRMSHMSTPSTQLHVWTLPPANTSVDHVERHGIPPLFVDCLEFTWEPFIPQTFVTRHEGVANCERLVQNITIEFVVLCLDQLLEIAHTSLPALGQVLQLLL